MSIRWDEKTGAKISETHFVAGRIADGPQYDWHANGQMRSETFYLEGQEAGTATRWWWNGQKRTETHDVDGKEDGVVTGWHPNGQKSYEATYENGIERAPKRWDEDGNER